LQGSDQVIGEHECLLTDIGLPRYYCNFPFGSESIQTFLWPWIM
jgi:hypothetical protein